MYGFHAHPVTFARVHLFSPAKVKAVVALLQSGKALGHAFQPYEAHVPYLLQFMIDYNVAGMASLHLHGPRCRTPLPSIASSRSVHVQGGSSLGTPGATPPQTASSHASIISPTTGRQPGVLVAPPPASPHPPCVPLPSLLPFSARQWAAGEVTLPVIHRAGLVCHTEALFWNRGAVEAPSSPLGGGRGADAEHAAQSVWVADRAAAAPHVPHQPPIQRMGASSPSPSPFSAEGGEGFTRCSVCELEVDVSPEQIRNPRLRREAAARARQRILAQMNTSCSSQSQPDAHAVAAAAGGVKLAPGLLAVDSLAELWTEEAARREVLGLDALKPPGIDALHAILNRSAAAESPSVDLQQAFPFVCQLPPKPLLHSTAAVPWTSPGAPVTAHATAAEPPSSMDSVVKSVFAHSSSGSPAAESATKRQGAASGSPPASPPSRSAPASGGCTPVLSLQSMRVFAETSVADCSRDSLPEEWRDILDSQQPQEDCTGSKVHVKAVEAAAPLLPPRLAVRRPKRRSRRRGSKRPLPDMPLQPVSQGTPHCHPKASHGRVVSFAPPCAEAPPPVRPPSSSTLLQPSKPPPLPAYMEGTALGLHLVQYAHKADMGRGTVEFFGRRHTLVARDVGSLPVFDAALGTPRDVFTEGWSQGQVPLQPAAALSRAAVFISGLGGGGGHSVLLQPSCPPPPGGQTAQRKPAQGSDKDSSLQRPANMSNGSGAKLQDVSFETLSQAGFQRKAATPATADTAASHARSDVNQQLTCMCVEVIAACRGSLSPDPAQDSLLAIVLSVADDNIVSTAPGALAGAASTTGTVTNKRGHVSGVIFVDPGRAQWPGCSSLPPPPVGANTGLLPPSDAQVALQANNCAAQTAVGIVDRAMRLQQPCLPTAGADASVGMQRRLWAWPVPDEASALAAFIWCVRAWDVDILMSYDTQKMGLGYIMRRAQELQVPLGKLLSRTPYGPEDTAMHYKADKDAYGARHGGGGGLWVVGRDVLNVWRIMRSEVKLPMYTLQYVCEQVLKLRMPTFPASKLAAEFLGGASSRHQAVRYVVKAAEASLGLLDHLNVIGRTSEMARLFGIDFHSVLTRGSQFRVEAVMLRVAKPLLYSPPSASRPQVAQQPAMELIPLILEPRSRLYRCPVIVLDFQSLYPSVIIAYNLCFTTCLGKGAVDSGAAAGAAAPQGVHSLGFMPYSPPKGAIGELGPSLFTTRNNVTFVPKSVRPGVLPRMLQEILETRVMVKNSMKLQAVQNDPVLTRILNARQFALKMIANVTYGYTSAGYSGRMPCAEIADSIVQTGRTTLERAIRMVEDNAQWRARVVYGDTDSMFVAVPGRSTAAAWQIGADIAQQVTQSNPPPVKLKLEKVYTSSVLVSKKRYAGFMLERPSQTAPQLDVKGLEAVRRDACLGMQRAMQDVLRMMFTVGDLSAVRTYLHKLWFNIVQGTVAPSDWVFAREVRLGMYRGPTPPPSAIVATRAMYHDPQAAPLYGERVPFVVVYGAPGARLVDLVVSPGDFAAGSHSQLNAVYYITKCLIPSLERILNLCGADVARWFVDFRERHGVRSGAAASAAEAVQSTLPPIQAYPLPGTASELHAMGLSVRPVPAVVQAAMHAAACSPPQSGARSREGTVDGYYSSQKCRFCTNSSPGLVCSDCAGRLAVVEAGALQKRQALEAELGRVQAACAHCFDRSLYMACRNFTCGNLWHRMRCRQALAQAHSDCVQLGSLFTGQVIPSSTGK